MEFLSIYIYNRSFQKNSHWQWLMLLFLGVSPLWLQGQSFTVSPTSVNISTDESFTITYTLQNASLQDFQAPGLGDFHLMGGPNRSQSMQIINGSMSSSTSISYILRPKKAGTFTIASAIATSDKRKTYRAKKVTVQVSKGSVPTPNVAPSTRPNSAGGGGGQLGSEGRIWVGIITDTTNVYQGQQITATYRLYTNVDITNYSINSAPSLTGFWMEDITPQTRQTPNNVAIDDVMYRTLDLKKYALFPQRSGALDIDAMQLEVIARIPDPRGGQTFFGPRYVSRTLDISSDTISVNVFPLPAAGKPVDFSGAVGKFRIGATLDNRNIKTNEAVQLTINVAGQGNIKLIEPPSLELPPSIETYDPVISEDVYTKMDRVNGRKTFEYTLIANEAGRHRIPEITFTYFDTDSNTYRIVQTPPYILNVAQGQQDPSTSTDDALQMGDIYPILGSTKLHRKKQPTINIAKTVAFGTLFALPFFILPFVWRQHQKREAELSDTVSLKRKLANKVAAQRLLTAKNHMQKGDKRAFYDEIIHAIWGYLSDKLNMPLSELSKENIAQELDQYGVSEASIHKVTNTIAYCEMALYAPVADADNLQGAYDSAANLIADIEETIEEQSEN